MAGLRAGNAPGMTGVRTDNARTINGGKQCRHAIGNKDAPKWLHINRGWGQTTKNAAHHIGGHN
eukprot:5254723-Lingulodinium_polyedra.AAC.1